MTIIVILKGYVLDLKVLFHTILIYELHVMRYTD
jgi:hypothetical protein